MKTIAYYITAHGYGHGTRSCDIINALHAAAPDVPVIIKTDLPPDFLQSRLHAHHEIIPGAFDAGLIQIDSIQVDLEASFKAVESIHAQTDTLVSGEMEFFARRRVGAVVSDIPAIPLTAAKQAGIPAIATGNFGWDWIYADFAKHDERWSMHAELFRTAYRQADLLLRQPFAEPMEAFPRRIDLPLLAAPGTACRKLIAKSSGADPAKQWILLSFTALNIDRCALENLSHLYRCELFSVEPLRWPGSTVRYLKCSTARFSDILASMDVVITKPGFGILSECIANDRPIIYTERNHFREYAVLVENIERYCRHAYLPGQELYAGHLERALKDIETAPPPGEKMSGGGAALAARQILAFIGR